MDLSVDLFVRAHPSGYFTLGLVGDKSVQIYTDDLDAARQDLQLLLSDRIERTHPRHQSAFAPPFEMTHTTLDVDNVIVVEGPDGPTKDPTTVSMLVGERRGWRSLYFPRLDLFFWVPKRGVDHLEAARDLLRQHFESLPESDRIRHRFDDKEWVETMAISAEPPTLSAFTGKNRGLSILPVPVHEFEDPDEDPKAAKAKKKKRPPTPTLTRIGVPLFRHAADNELERAFERKQPIDELFTILTTKGHTCVAVVGPSGVGKSAVLNELVYRLRDRSPDRPVWFADASRLVATDGFYGDWQRQVFDVAKECAEADVVWYIGALLPLLDAGKHIGSEQNVSQLLRPYLAGRRITVVAEATPHEWSRLELRDVGFARLFTAYRLEEPAEAEADAITHAVVRTFERDDSVAVTEDGLQTARQLCRRYHAEGSPLGVSIAFLRRLVEYAAARDETTADKRTVVDFFCQETGLPARLVRDDVVIDPAEVRRAFEARLVGQSLAVGRMTDLIAVIKAGLSDLSRPLGSFLFVGPTGVGKTETAKALAAYLFGSAHRIVRFDMSEFMGGDAVHRFLGDQHGEGKLVEAIRRRPFSVVLLDEIEKAHPAVFDVLLQVLGEARLTDETGRVADFRNAVIVMTSNLGVETLKRRVGFSPGDTAQLMETHFLKEAEQFFRPEFFNRIDHIVPFMPLEAEAIRHITTRELDKLLAREGIRQRGLSLTLSDDVPPWLAARGIEPRYGARPLKRTIERTLTIPLARHLAARRSAVSGLAVNTDGEALVFEPTDAGERDTPVARAKAVVRALIETVGLVRFRAARWMNGVDYLDLLHEVRLYDQLTRTKHFWANRELAERRGQGMAEKQELERRFDRVVREVEGIEDLAFEAYHRRELTNVDALSSELAIAERELDSCELELFGMRFSSPDRAVLYLLPPKDFSPFFDHLVDVYLSLIWELGHRADVFTAKRIVDKEKKKTSDEKKPRVDAKAERKAEKKRRRSERWLWKKQGHFDPATLFDAESPEEVRVRRWRLEHVGREGAAAVALSIVGPSAAAFYSNEHGRHQRIADEETLVRVVFDNLAVSSAGSLRHPNDLAKSLALVRTVRERQRVVEDHVLGGHVAIEPRLYRLYLRLIRQRIAKSALGAGGPALTRAWSTP